MEYRGVISGFGDLYSRVNEITADELACGRNFIVGYNGKLNDVVGVIISDLHHDFDCSKIGTNKIKITDGMGIAYGYVAYSDSIIIDFLLPAVMQYHLVYLELNRSVVPNICTIKTKNNQSSHYFDTAFRRDVLSSVKTGVFQFPLWLIKITNKGITEIKDIRNRAASMERAYYTKLSHRVSKRLDNGVTCTTQNIADKSKKIANTAFVHNLIAAEINK